MEVPSYTPIDDSTLHQNITQSERSHMIHNFFDYRTKSDMIENMENDTSFLASLKQKVLPLPSGDSDPMAFLDNIISNVYTYMEDETQTGLAGKQQEVNTREVILQTTYDETSNLYQGIYVILVGLLVAVLLAAITAGRSMMGEKLYLALFWVLLISYIIYVIYLFDLFFVRDGVQKIWNYIRFGRIDLGEVNFDIRIDQGSSYIQRQCAMKKAEEEKNEPLQKSKDTLPVANELAFVKDFSRKGEKTDNVYYRDRSSTLQRVYPTDLGNQSVYYPDQDGAVLYERPTDRL
jgi:hypothetical protein